MTLQEQVLEFHLKYGHPIEGRPHIPVDKRVRFRASLIAEEFFETLEAIFAQSSTEGDTALRRARELIDSAINRGLIGIDLAALADGLADIDYVVEGTRLEFGINGGPIAVEVHRANMTKSGRNAAGKTIKPPGWTSPDIDGELRKQEEGENCLDTIVDRLLEGEDG
jgi:predicted HAD superfamily Cof-like phosphohydrolase